MCKVQIYFSVRTFRVLAAMLFSSCESDDGVERRCERGGENALILFCFGPSHLPSSISPEENNIVAL